MPGIIRKAEDVIQSVAPQWTTTRVIPRGVPRYIDPQLRGPIRYANRVGSFIPNIQPDNQTTLATAAQARGQELQLTRILDGTVPGTLVQIDGQEIQMVSDVIESERKIQTVNRLKTAYPAGTKVDLFGEPYVSTGISIASPRASLSITQGPATLALEAANAGPRGNAVSIAVVVPEAAGSALRVGFVGLAVEVRLATDGTGQATSTFGEVSARINDTLGLPLRSAVSGDENTVLSAFPKIKLTGGSDTSTIAVRGRFHVLVGDKLWIQSNEELLLSGTDHTVVAVEGYSNSLSLINSVVVLDRPIPRDLTIGSQLFLRGFPAYRSNVLNVPHSRRMGLPIGPFVVDYASGRFTDGPSPRETLSLQTFDGLDNPVSGPYPTAVHKNTPVLGGPIHQSSFLFFDRYRGTVTYRNDRLVMRNDDRGRCEIFFDLVPGWDGPAAWKTRIRFASPTVNSFYFRFEPNPTDFAAGASGSGNNSVTATIELKAGQQRATRLVLVTSGEPGAEIEMDGWDVVGQQVESLQYGLTSEQVGPNDWQAGSIQLKPYFKTLADLQTNLDFDSLDSGTILL